MAPEFAQGQVDEFSYLSAKSGTNQICLKFCKLLLHLPRYSVTIEANKNLVQYQAQFNSKFGVINLANTSAL